MRLTDYIDQRDLTKLLDDFSKSVGIYIDAVDTKGKSFLLDRNYGKCEFCKYIQSTEKGMEKCIRSYENVSKECYRWKDTYFSTCHAGIVLWSFPIVIEEEQVGAIVCGQVLLWKPDRYFYKQLKQFNDDISDIDILKKYFTSVSIEVMPLDEEDYAYLKNHGLDGLTVYQETYDEKRYSEVHLSGEKRNFKYRLDTPERGAIAGLRTIGIGALLGLGSIREDAFRTGLHLKYLMDNYPNSDFSISFPRVNKAEGNLKDSYAVDDKTFVQIILANRIFQPTVGINLSTRESSHMRDNLVSLGITKFSAGSKVEVGGYSHNNESTAQFDITDSRSVEEIVAAINKRGLEVSYKEWENIV